MIVLEGVGKRWPGAAAPSVEGVDLTVPAGTCCALIGPSGCGKTTTLRMVNRMVEPTAGRVLLDGRDVAGLDPVRLRRGIGYVIQSGGLFPHRSVAANVATVPELLGWPPARVRARVDEVLALVGLDPGTYGPRAPRTLSGGQQQRVGVARALAADPPVLLMDEPFGAVDPVVRGRLQAELRRLLAGLGKTVMVVTHDVEEAVRLGDAVAVMEAGRLVRHAPPAALLADPGSPSVAALLGGDRALRRLGLLPAAASADAAAAGEGAPLPAGASLRDALGAMLERGARAVPLEGGGAVTVAALLEAARAPADRTP